MGDWIARRHEWHPHSRPTRDDIFKRLILLQHGYQVWLLHARGKLLVEERQLADGWASQTVAADGTTTSDGRPQTRQYRLVTEWRSEDE